MSAYTSDRMRPKCNAEGPESDVLPLAPTIGKRSPSLLIQNPPLCVTPDFGASINSYKISGIVTPVSAATFPKFGVEVLPFVPVEVAILKAVVYFSVPAVPGSTRAPDGRIAFQYVLSGVCATCLAARFPTKI